VPIVGKLLKRKGDKDYIIIDGAQTRVADWIYGTLSAKGIANQRNLLEDLTKIFTSDLEKGVVLELNGLYTTKYLNSIENGFRLISIEVAKSFAKPITIESSIICKEELL
jgi:hypothetical protein